MASIKKRRGKYSVVYYYIDENGQKRQKWETYLTEKEAKQRKAEIEYKQGRRTFIAPNKVTVAAFLEDFVSLYGTKKWGPNTYDANLGLIQNYINPNISDMVDPVEMAKWSYDNGYWCKSSGSYHALIPAAAEEWGLPVSGCTTSEPQRILDALADGKLVVAIMSEGHFTSSGHFIVLRGVKDGQIMVADPASYKRSGQLWDLSIILNEASRRAAAGGPFWIIG